MSRSRLTLAMLIALGATTATAVASPLDTRRAYVDFESGKIVRDLENGPMADQKLDTIDHRKVLDNETFFVGSARLQQPEGIDFADAEYGSMLLDMLLDDAASMRLTSTPTYGTEALKLIGQDADGNDRPIGDNWVNFTYVVNKVTGEVNYTVAPTCSLECVGANSFAIVDGATGAWAVIDTEALTSSLTDETIDFAKMISSSPNARQYEGDRSVFLTRGGPGKVMISDGVETQLFTIGEDNALEFVTAIEGIALSAVQIDGSFDASNVVKLDDVLDGGPQVTRHTRVAPGSLGETFEQGYRKAA